LAEREGRRILRRARTAASLPGRVVACEDRTAALEAHVVQKIDEMRSELAEIRSLLHAQLAAESEATELMGNLLQSAELRLAALEDRTTDVLPIPAALDAGGPSRAASEPV
jgi:hypothetical protein